MNPIQSMTNVLTVRVQKQWQTLATHLQGELIGELGRAIQPFQIGFAIGSSARHHLCSK